MQGQLGMSGSFNVQVISPVRSAPLSWKLKNTLRWHFLKSWFGARFIAPLANRFGIATVVGTWSIRVKNGLTGVWTDYGIVSYRVITDVGVGLIADYWTAGTPDLQAMKYLGIGTGAGAEAAGETALVTESTTALNPDSTRATGTLSNPTAPVVRVVGTLTCDADIAVIEAGLFNQAATGGGVLFDRSLFSVINLVGANPDSIQLTYDCTFSSGG